MYGLSCRQSGWYFLCILRYNGLVIMSWKISCYWTMLCGTTIGEGGGVFFRCETEAHDQRKGQMGLSVILFILVFNPIDPVHFPPLPSRVHWLSTIFSVVSLPCSRRVLRRACVQAYLHERPHLDKVEVPWLVDLCTDGRGRWAFYWWLYCVVLFVKGTVVFQIFGAALFSVVLVVKGLPKLKKTPK